VTLEADVNQVWSDFLPEWSRSQEVSKSMRDLAALTAGSIKTLAGQIDLLRSELVEKGIDVRT
jgi:hypothetical protein